MIPSNDIKQIALDRIVAQYGNSTKLRAVVEAFVDEIVELRDAAIALFDIVGIDTTDGYNLDTLGEILGQSRELASAAPIAFFGFDTALGADGFGDDTNPALGGRFRSINEPEAGSVLLGDAEYRHFLTAKKLRNVTRATPEEVIDVIREILNDGVAVNYSRSGDAQATYTVQRVLSTDEIQLLNATGGVRGEVPIVPRPIGVEQIIAGL